MEILETIIEIFFNLLNLFLVFVSSNLVVFQALSISLSAVFIWLIIYYIVKIGLIRERVLAISDVLTAKKISRHRSLRAWKKIKKRLHSGRENEWKLAVLESDRILDEILKLGGYPGKNLDEKLKIIIPEQIPSIEEINFAHKMAKRITSEPDFRITQTEALSVVSIYKKAFQELNLME